MYKWPFLSTKFMSPSKIPRLLSFSSAVPQLLLFVLDVQGKNFPSQWK